MNSHKIKDVINHLINYELKPHNLTVKDVENREDWITELTTTSQKEKEFFEYGVQYIRKTLRYSKKLAEKNMSHFILQYGLRIDDGKKD